VSGSASGPDGKPEENSMRESIAGALIGSSVKRVEDKRILTGNGRYVADVTVPGMAHAAFLRSPFPHARILSVDASAAREVPGVLAVYTGADLAAIARPLAQLAPTPGQVAPPYDALATDKVRLVGDPVAIVVAEDRYIAEDARQLIDVDYEPLDPVADIDQALDPASARVWEEGESNVVFTAEHHYGDAAAAFARADRVVTETFRQHRIANMPMETRGAVAEVNPASGEMVYHAATQSPHLLRMILSATIGQPAHLLRVVAGDVGGAFGTKGLVYKEDVALAAVAKHLGRSVRWIEDRNEHLLTGGQAREENVTVEAAVRNDGTILALRVHLVMDQGAYPGIPFSAPLFTNIIRVMLPGPYRLEGYDFDASVVATNKGTYVAYRGPWEVETWARERMMDVIARELGMDRVELRLKNMVGPDELPVPMITGPTLDVRMSAKRTLEEAVARAGYPDWVEEQRRAREEGRIVGLGIATYIEAAPGPPDYSAAIGFASGREQARVKIELDGSVTVITAQAPHGQGHETTLAQVAADTLGVAFESVRVVHGDTNVTPFSLIGTGGSRSAAMAGGAVTVAAREVRARILGIASALLETPVADLELADGVVSVKGAPQVAVPLAQIATVGQMAPQMLPPGTESRLDCEGEWTGGEGGWAQSTHVCWVEIDPLSGRVRIPRYLVAEDCGEIINPAIVDGQVRGGIAQGIGAVLYERSAYDEWGQFVAGTFMDYLLPTAMEIPDIEIHHVETPSDVDVNFRGVGEGGMIGAPAAITNAIEDALADRGVRITEQYLPPARILELAGVL